MGFLKYWQLDLPLTYLNIIWRKLDKKAKTILDVGCGDGSLMALLNYGRRFKVTGVDLYKPYLEKAKKTKVYKKVVLEDVRKLDFGDKSFDIVFCSQVIEHLTKEEGERLIENLEKIAKKQVIITTTVGFFPYDPFEGKDENPFQTHKSRWQPEEFKESLHPPIFFLSYLFSPLFYLFPKLAAYMICVKNL